MSNRLTLWGIAILGLTVVTLSSCGIGGSPESVPNQSSVTQSPSTGCVKFLPDAPCGKFGSTAGTAAGHPISWVTEGEITAQLDRVGEDTYLTAILPCGPINAAVTVDGSNMVLSGKMAIGASGCVDEAKVKQRTWALSLLEKGVQLEYSNGALTWTSGLDSLTFGAI